VDCYVTIENYAAATKILTKFIEQYPNDPGARARLEQVREMLSKRTK
jgi:hypothetical protein